MKTDDATAPAATTTDETTTPAAKPKRKAEPTSSRLSNLSRVTPGQVSAVSFPADARYVPVRPVGNTTSSTAAPSAGGILMVRDQQPEKEGEFLEMEVTKAIDTSAPAEVIAATGGDAAAGASPDVDLSGPIADPPPAFEWTDWE